MLTAFFIPAYNVVNTPECIDKRGFTDPEKGKEYYNKKRIKLLNDRESLLIEIAEYCFTAEEAFSLEGDNKFNKVNITNQLMRIQTLHETPSILRGSFNLLNNDGMKNITGSVWIPNNNGLVLILEPPIWETEGGDKIDNLYVAGIDGIDIGKAQTSSATKGASDFCIVIKRRTYGLRPPKYVAVYKDRPYSEKDAFKIAMGLAMYYNARINIEATRMSMLIWAREYKLGNWFMKRPIATYADSNKRSSNAYGTPATPAIINHLTDLIKEFTDDYCDDLWFEEMLDLLNRYSDENKGKFDYIAAMGMAELADEELNVNSIIPKLQILVQPVKEHLGYYYDEYGIKRFGYIPEIYLPLVNYTEESYYYNYGLNQRTSDPRYYW